MTEEVLVCPKCGDENLATIESIQGLADAVFTLTSNGERETDFNGETVILWDTSTTVGIHCRSCDWDWEDEARPDADAIDMLVTKAEFEASKQEEAEASLEGHPS